MDGRAILEDAVSAPSVGMIRLSSETIDQARELIAATFSTPLGALLVVFFATLVFVIVLGLAHGRQRRQGATTAHEKMAVASTANKPEATPTATSPETFFAIADSVGKVAKAIWSGIAAVAGAAFILIAILIVKNEVVTKSIVVSGVSVPAQFDSAGFTETVMARLLNDALHKYLEDNNHVKLNTARVWVLADEPNLNLPEIDVSTNVAADDLSKLIGLDQRTHLLAEFTEANGTLAVTLRLDGKVVATAGRREAISSLTIHRLLSSAAQGFWEREDPFFAANRMYYEQKWGKATEIAKRIVGSIAGSDRYQTALAQSLLGAIYGQEGRCIDAVLQLNNAIPALTSVDSGTDPGRFQLV